MANSMPFNSVSGDRKFKAEDWAWYFGTFIGNGVFPKPETGLQVVVNADMKVTVKEGKAFINGYAFKNASDYEITLDTADGALGRIDRVIVRWDLTKRDIYIEVLKGTVSANPVPQDITRNTEIFDLVIADILVSKGVTSIAQANITDQRYNSNLCGIVKGTIEEIDASALTAQFEDFTNRYQEEKLAEFEEWVESIKDVLGEDAAGNLQLQIDEHVNNNDNPHNITAEQIPIDKEISGMSAEDVQGAIDELKNAVGDTSKNILDNTAKTTTTNGVTFTVNSDKSVTITGKLTGNFAFINLNYVNDTTRGIPIGNFIVSSGISNENVKVEIMANGAQIAMTGVDKEKSFSITENHNNSWARIAVYDKSELNITVYPMIRPENIKDDTYEPYKLTVRSSVFDLEKIEYSKNMTTPVAETRYYTYKATRRCIINLSFSACFGVTGAKSLTIYKNDTTACSSYDKDGASLTGSVNLILEAGDEVRCNASYVAENTNGIRILGYVQYLE